jgi:uncharacterized protein involved in exopolysaccharide biosynthesis
MRIDEAHELQNTSMTSSGAPASAGTSSVRYAEHGAGYEVNVLSLTALLTRRRRMLASLAAAFSIVTLIVAIVSPRTYTATASFTPQTKRGGMAGAAGLAAQLGITVPNSDGTQSPAFYADVLKSREILSAVVADTIALGQGERSVRAPVSSVVGDGSDSARRVASAMKWLEKHVAADVAQRSGIITVAVTTKSAQLSYQLVTAIVDELTRFNLESRQSQASAERKFTESRLRESRDSLRIAENRGQEFLQRNHDYSRSPELSFQHDALAREISFRQQVYASLAQAYEQARLDEVRDTPTLTITDRPAIPLEPNGRALLVKTLVAAIAGLVVGFLLVVAQEAFAAARAPTTARDGDFGPLRGELLSDVRRPPHFVMPAARGTPSPALADRPVSQSANGSDQ